MNKGSREEAGSQRSLTQFDDELRKYCEQKDGEMFDREERLAMLENQEGAPVPTSIFGAIFQELKNQAKRGKHRTSHDCRPMHCLQAPEP